MNKVRCIQSVDGSYFEIGIGTDGSYSELLKKNNVKMV